MAVFPARVCCGIRAIVSVSRLADHYVRRKLLCELTNDEACDIITVDTTITAPLCCSATAWLVRNKTTTAEKQTGSWFAPAEPSSTNLTYLNNLAILCLHTILWTSLQHALCKHYFSNIIYNSSIVPLQRRTYTRVLWCLSISMVKVYLSNPIPTPCLKSVIFWPRAYCLQFFFNCSELLFLYKSNRDKNKIED